MTNHQVHIDRRLPLHHRISMSRLEIHRQRQVRMLLCSIIPTRNLSHLIERTSSTHASINHLFSMTMLSKEGANTKFKCHIKKAQFHINQTVTLLDRLVKTKQIATSLSAIKYLISEISKNRKSLLIRHSIRQAANKKFRIKACS